MQNHSRPLHQACVLTSALLFSMLGCLTTVAADKPPTLMKSELGATRNVHSFGKTLLCGQPTEAEFAEARKRGIKTVITLREKTEIDWNEAEKTVSIMGDPKSTPVMLHCASANRVGALWLAHRVLNDKIDIEKAREEAKAVGLRTPEYEQRVLEYIKQKNSKQ